jgi:hypothetical protein
MNFNLPNFNLPKLETEADVINLIGYDTPMKFTFTSEGIMEFETLIPKSYANMDLFTYVVEFFIEENTLPEFFAYDCFSSFLEKYQIHTVKINYKGQNVSDEIYFRTYQEN